MNSKSIRECSQLVRRSVLFCFFGIALCWQAANADSLPLDDRLQLLSAAHPIKFQAEESAASKRFKRIFGPVHFTFNELIHPVSLIRAARNRLRWNMPDAQSRYAALTGARGANIEMSQEALDTALGASNFDVARNFDLALSRTPAYQLQSDGPRFAGARVLKTTLVDPLSRYAATPAQSLLLYRTSATQLQVRVRNEVSFLWEVERSSSVIQGDELGLGMGLRYSF